MGTGIVLETQEGLARHWDRRHTGDGWIIDPKTGQDKPAEPHVMAFIGHYGFQINRVLDAACGPGRHTIPLARLKRNVTGVDISSVAIEQARQRLEARGLDPNIVEVGDLCSLRFADREFDTIVCAQVMGHMPSWATAKQVFAEFSRVLGANGLLFLRVRSTSRDLPKDAQVITDNGDLPPDQIGATYSSSRHGELLTYRSYSLPELQWLAKQNGLQIVGEPLDEQRFRDGAWIKGQWNVVFRKEVN